MGYTTTFRGKIAIVPALTREEMEYLKQFSGSRRMSRTKGGYYIGTGEAGQDHEADVLDYNKPPDEQPGLWCQWVPTKDGKGIEWNGFEKFYFGAEWMFYLIVHFLGTKPLAKEREPDTMSFLIGHTLNGEIKAQGEEDVDRWTLIVKDNIVTVKDVRGEKQVGTEWESYYCRETHKNQKNCDSCQKRFTCWTQGRKLSWGNYGQSV